MTMQHTNAATTQSREITVRASRSSAAAAASLSVCFHFHILHKMETAKHSSPAVPVAILVLMKCISRLNLPAQAAGRLMKALRLNQLWLIVGRGWCRAVGVSLICF